MNSWTDEDSFVVQLFETNKDYELEKLLDHPKMVGHHTEIDFVKSNFEEDKLLYIDKERAEQWNKEWALKTKSSGGELESKVQFLGQRITDIETYIPSILTKERLVNFISGGLQSSKNGGSSCKK